MVVTEQCSRFQYFLQEYERTQGDFRLPNTNKSIKIYKKNNLDYLDIDNLLIIFKELFNYNIPNEMVYYIQNIFLIENITIEENSSYCIKELICAQFVDKNSLQKCEKWLKEHWEDQNEIEDTHNYTRNCGNYDHSAPLIEENLIQKESSCIFPISEMWGAADADTIFKNVQDNDLSFVQGSERLSPKPRGKTMSIKKYVTSDRPFVCEYPMCNRAFKRFEHLKRHTKMHTGEKPFKCRFPGCERSFSRSDNCNAHFKTHSSINNGPFGGFALFDKNYEKF